MTLLNIAHLFKNYGSTRVLTDVSLTVDAGEFVAVMGRSGGGKSTLLYCVAGMDAPSAGTVSFHGRDLGAVSAEKRQAMRLKNMGFIFQKPYFLKNLTIADNILFPGYQLGAVKRGILYDEMEALLEETGIAAIAGKNADEVSGGELQRAAICRALINHPDIVFGDEITGALPTAATNDVLDLLLTINAKGTAIFLVTHDAKVAARADRVLYLEDGQIKATLSLGNYTAATAPQRQDTMDRWLKKMKF